MSKPLWDSEDAKPIFPRPSLVARISGLVRGILLALLLIIGLIVLLILRVVEAPLFGIGRPVTPFLVQVVCKAACRLLRLRVTVTGTLSSTANALVSNHSTWLDIFVLNALSRGYFVAKAEVSQWPGIGWLARATGTVFVERKRSQAREHGELLARRLASGHRLIFFPEGTSTDGQLVLPFKSTLFEPLRTKDENGMEVQPISIFYRPPQIYDARSYGWWGGMTFTPHLIDILCLSGRGEVEITMHEPIVSGTELDRKELALQCGDAVAKGHAALRAASQAP